jgi:hypothetical protein
MDQPAAYWERACVRVSRGKRYLFGVAQGAQDGGLRAKPSSSDHMTCLQSGVPGDSCRRHRHEDGQYRVEREEKRAQRQ